MKKIIAILIAGILCLSALAIPAMADTPAFSVTSATAQRGEQVTLNISVSGVVFAGLQVDISYNKSALEIVDCASLLSGSSFTKGNPDRPTYKPNWYGSENITASGTIASITFKVLDTAPKGNYTISVSTIMCSDQEGNDVKIGSGSGTVTVTIPACATHSWNAGVETTPATCETSGLKTYTCSVCTETKTEVIQALGHSWNAGVETTKPTCLTKGEKTYTCTRGNCGATKKEEIQALGHDWGDWKETTKATCLTKGEKTSTCKRDNCGATQKEEIQALGHDWDDGKETTKATCLTKGEKTFTCKRNCGATKTEDIQPLGHKWGKWIGDEENHIRTCQNKGCTEKDVEPHNWDEGNVTTKATCVNKGEKTYTCRTCFAQKKELLEPTGIHDYTHHYEFTEGEDVHYGFCSCGAKGEAEKHAYTQEGEVLEKPTTTKQGKQEKLCVCGDKIVVTLDKIPAEYDNVPKTGDITGQLVLTGVVILLGIGGAVCLLKRKRIV